MSKHNGKHGLVRLIIRQYTRQSKSCPSPQGPIGLLLQSLREVGADLDENLCITQPNEAPIDIWCMPFQHLKKAVAEIAIRDRLRREAAHRQHLAGVAELDGPIFKNCINKEAWLRRGLLRMSPQGALGGMTSLRRLGEAKGIASTAGYRVRALSTFIGSVLALTSTGTYASWSAYHRRLCLRTSSMAFPAQWMAGWTNLSGGQGSMALPTSIQSASACLASVQQLSRGMCSRPSRSNSTAFLAEHKMCGDTMNARQIFQNVKAMDATPHMPLPEPCTRAPPAMVNAYSDGSWINPLRQFLGLGGAGVVWPGRDLQVLPLSQAERELAHHEQDADGVTLYTAIGGYGGSSTRTELAAGILAISCSGPVHLGTDSAAFKEKADSILASLHCNSKIDLNWKLQTDGDLWEHFYKAVVAKGPAAVCISKVKGHATSEQVVAGVVTEQDNRGNDLADAAADKGVLVHGEVLVKIAGRFDQRHRDYGDFMHDVHKHIVEGHLIHRALLDRDAKEPSPVGITLPQLGAQGEASCIAAPSATRSKLCLTSTVRRYAGIQKSTPAAFHYEQFLRELVVAPMGQEGRGATWIELYILYRMSGHAKPRADDADTAKTRSPVDQQLLAFKRELRRVIQRVLINSDDLALFSPAPQTLQPLVDLAIVGFLPMVSFKVALTEEASSTLQQLLLKFAHGINKERATRYLTQRRGLKPRKILLKGHAAWDSQIPKLSSVFASDCGIRTGQEHKIALAPSRRPKVGMPSCFACPNCGGQDPSSANCFQVRDLDQLHICSRCKRRSAVRDWRCGCDTLWHLCPVHEQDPEQYRWGQSRSLRKRAASGVGSSLCAPLAKKPKSQVIVRADINHLLSDKLKERLGL